jgi:hypothetical protein
MDFPSPAPAIERHRAGTISKKYKISGNFDARSVKRPRGGRGHPHPVTLLSSEFRLVPAVQKRGSQQRWEGFGPYGLNTKKGGEATFDGAGRRQLAKISSIVKSARFLIVRSTFSILPKLSFIWIFENLGPTRKWLGLLDV